MIGRAYARFLESLKIAKADRRPLKLLRKTAASRLGQHREHSRYAQHFLGHAPRTIAEKHYVRPYEEQFDNAIRWLGEQLTRVWQGFTEDATPPEKREP